MSPEVKMAIKELSEINLQSEKPQSIYVTEECAELTQELMKELRGKPDEVNLVKEACDVLTTVLVLLHQHQVSEDYIRNHIINKTHRASQRSMHNEF